MCVSLETQYLKYSVWNEYMVWPYDFPPTSAFSALGGCIIYTVGLSFLHESVNPSESPVYIGIFYGVGGIGPAVGQSHKLPECWMDFWWVIALINVELSAD